MGTPIVTTTAEQMEHNREVCPNCGVLRFQHLNAVLCTENEPTLADVLAEIQAVRTEVGSVVAFIQQLEAAIMSHPMAKMLMGG